MQYAMLILRGFLLAAILGITACASDNDDNSSSSINEYTELSGSLTSQGNSLSGDGSVIFTASLGANASGKHIAVVVALDTGDSITIHAYSNNQLTNGIDLMVSRPASTPTNLQVTLAGTDVSSSFTTVAADQAISIVMDVHNDENPAHVLIWPAGESAFGEMTTLENSEDTGSVSSQGVGTRAIAFNLACNS